MNMPVNALLKAIASNVWCRDQFRDESNFELLENEWERLVGSMAEREDVTAPGGTDRAEACEPDCVTKTAGCSQSPQIPLTKLPEGDSDVTKLENLENFRSRRCSVR